MRQRHAYGTLRADAMEVLLRSARVREMETMVKEREARLRAALRPEQQRPEQ